MKDFIKQHVYIILGILCIIIMGGLFIFGGHRPSPREAGEVLTDAGYTDTPNDETSAITQHAAPGYVIVDIVGAVYNPGVFTLPVGARVYQAIEMAGGYTSYAERRAVNGAVILQDEMQIFVPTAEEAAMGIGGFIMPGVAHHDDGLICLNAATYEQLRTLSGIGTVIATNIINHRESIGGFTHVEQLLDVARIGHTTFNNIRSYITVR